MIDDSIDIEKVRVFFLAKINQAKREGGIRENTGNNIVFYKLPKEWLKK